MLFPDNGGDSSMICPDNDEGGDGDSSMFSAEAEEHTSGPSIRFALTGFWNKSAIFACFVRFCPGFRIFDITAHVSTRYSFTARQRVFSDTNK